MTGHFFFTDTGHVLGSLDPEVEEGLDWEITALGGFVTLNLAAWQFCGNEI